MVVKRSGTNSLQYCDCYVFVSPKSMPLVLLLVLSVLPCWIVVYFGEFHFHNGICICHGCASFVTIVLHLSRLCCIYHDCVAFITIVLHLSRLCFPLCFYSFFHSRFIWWWFDLVWSAFWPLIIRSISQAIYPAINILGHWSHDQHFCCSHEQH